MVLSPLLLLKKGMNMDEFEKGLYFGLILGVVAMLALWSGFSFESEKSKVREGYLTFENKTYTVTLYDELDKPEKE